MRILMPIAATRVSCLAALVVMICGCAETPNHRVPNSLCRNELDSILNAVQYLYGPPKDRWDLSKMACYGPPHDFNGDGVKELLLLFIDDKVEGIPVAPVSNLNPAGTRGFIVLTRIEGRFWPLFYCFSEYGVELEWAEECGIAGLRNSMYGEQQVWGWRKDITDWPGSQWCAVVRGWDQEQNTYGLPKTFPHCLANYGK